MKIIIDTREQKAWTFDDIEVINTKLDTGDYSIEGFADQIVIERKSSVSELAMNIVSKRFWNELERMKDIKYRIIICEFTEEDVATYPSKMPKYLRSRIRVRGKFILSKIREIEKEYKIKVEFCKNKVFAEIYAEDWLLQTYNKCLGAT